MKITPYIRNVLLSLPFLFATLIPYVYIAKYFDVSFLPKIIALGVFGWWFALLLRFPVIFLVRNRKQALAQNIVIAASGPAEEIVRLLLLVILGRTVQNAFLLGLGWAGIEIVYAFIQGFAMGVLEQRTDAKAQEAKAMLKLQGMEKTLTAGAPFWGVLERFSANALHLGFGLLLVVNPWLLAFTMLVHSFANFTLTRILKRSMALAEVILLICSLFLFIITLTLIMTNW